MIKSSTLACDDGIATVCTPYMITRGYEASKFICFNTDIEGNIIESFDAQKEPVFGRTLSKTFDAEDLVCGKTTVETIDSEGLEIMVIEGYSVLLNSKNK
ncbi:hypothetical protein [Maridesulfovibrio ferrireducens]|uniref:hypothetical protein n=1 Tax=Maridesulfovibrio ferrireducens TaxID=246191 RepID=UPI001A26BB3E|nr:hypothetical protein [Maridesulfovibrio ferrireducens]MBI9109988.1 hypothetical protein [Maridesulfovibrio ferrireducens]